MQLVIGLGLSVRFTLNIHFSNCPSGAKHAALAYFAEGELLHIIWKEACAILSFYNQLHYWKQALSLHIIDG